MRLAILQAPTNLGLRPGGVERAGDALLEARLAERLQARRVGRVAPRAAYAPVRDGTTQLLNGPGIAEHMGLLAEAITRVMDRGEVPLVLGGDDSVLLGAALALRRRGRYGLLFLDAHADFCPPADSPTGEVSDSDLAIVTGHGPPVLSDLDGLAPYLRPTDVVQLGRRDRVGALEAESRAFAASGVRAIELEELRRDGMTTSLARTLEVLSRRDLAGVWVHLDCDVLDDAVMPAVDYRVPGGLQPAELAEVLHRTVKGARIVGMTVSIYNPSLDADRAAARTVVAALCAGLGKDVPRG
jgi:arginase